MDLLRLTLVTALMFAWALPARAQVLSPGKLTKAHEQIEGLRNCTKCHSSGDRLDENLCRQCHTEIASREQAGSGYHGKVAVKKEDCADCHTDHRGRDFNIIDWGGPRDAFEHSQVGYDLTGAHATTKCRDCHDNRLVKDADIRKLLGEGKAKKTFLGLSQACRTCHFDEHRGQLSKRCGKCHGTKSFRPSIGFRHNRDTKFALTGKHLDVRCSQCHPNRTDSGNANAFPAPKKSVYAKYSGIAFKTCESCHKDPHSGHLGKNCASCHKTSGWFDLTEKADLSFHDKSRYPLRGEHRRVGCADCHGPFPGRKAVFKDMAFATCASADCHVDAHLGQLAYAPAENKTCEPCHTVDGFKPTTYGLAEHARTTYPLKGSHQAVACDDCHPQQGRLAKKFPSKVRKRLVRHERKVLMSTAVFDFEKKNTKRCETCHADIHAAQFDPRTNKAGCTFCHNETSFLDVKFDHNRYSRFKLRAAHAKTDCIECHRLGTLPNGKRGAIYRGVAQDCESCHADTHLGQFTDKSGKTTACNTCHTEQDFKQVLFVHNNPDFSDYPLKGQHNDVDCEKCHPDLKLTRRLKVTQYIDLPRKCEECHEDYHRDDDALKAMVARVDNSGADKSQGLTLCAECHNERTWADVRFEAHDETGFPLRGAHASAMCVRCHDQGFDTKQSHACTSCHTDVHRGELGEQCDTCHGEDDWESNFDVLAHRRTNFPLIGQHAMLPCQECHPSTQVGFAAAAAECDACHLDDYDRTALTFIDHKTAGFSTDCLSCHDPWSFRPAKFPEHDVCFNVSRGSHAGIRCQQCHTALASSVVTGACSTGTASCTGCHTHEESQTASEHVGVPGYDYQDAKCYSCHPFS